MSSLFPNSFFVAPSGASNNTSFHPLFRLLDDFEQHQHSRGNGNGNGNGHPLRTALKTFTPKFDVKELPEAYELHGDLPGIEQKDVEIEFTDIQTITVRGRTERSYTSGTPPSGFIEGAESSNRAQIEGSATEQPNANSKSAVHKATVEDEDAASTTVSTTSKNTNVANTNGKEEKHETESRAKYWVSERSVGEFSRSFSFPVRVDQESVTASMKNGVLSITVPKAKKHEAKKIPISA